MSNLEMPCAPFPLVANYSQSDNYLKGYIGKDLVKSLLESSGYTVCHYGYEDTLLDYLSKRTSKNSNSNTGRRIRKSPDLLVYDEQNIMLAEVKTRLTLPPIIEEQYRAEQISVVDILKEFWKDAILVLVVPDKNVFYAKKVCEIEGHGFRLSIEDLNKFEAIFTRVKDENISHYRAITLPILQLFMSKKQREKFSRTQVT